MVNWVHHGPVGKEHAKWMTTAEFVDGKAYLYYDFPNDADPHLYIDEDLTDGKPGKDMGLVFKDPSHGSDCAIIRDMDKTVGRLMSALDELDLRKRTIVIFTTDNGSDHKITGTRNGRKVEGGKGQTSETGVCEPFIVNGPGIVPAGVETDALTDFSDLLPTFVELGGGKIPDDLVVDGVSFAPLILGKQNDSDREWIMALGHGSAKLDKDGVRGTKDFAARVIRDKRYKVWVSEKKKINRLHDLQEDLLEEANLLASNLPEHKKAVEKFPKVVDSLPDKDARPLYEPRAANAWDRK